jgi:cephalosporin-C deacetylase
MFDTDPTHLYALNELCYVQSPKPPSDFEAFWQSRYQQAITLDPCPVLTPSDMKHTAYDCFELAYTSTENFGIKGWVIAPKNTHIKRAIVVSHGYGGREQPDFDLPMANTAFLFPCSRGLSRSRHPSIPDQADAHVLHQVLDRERYILGGCVEDVWLAVTALIKLFPSAQENIGYMGISFGGGIGVLALPWDLRIKRAHFNVPSFGHHELRLQIPTFGSAAALQRLYKQDSRILNTLLYYDAAVAAPYIRVPTHFALALSDAVVTPIGQFSIYNAVTFDKALFVLDKGHGEYPRQSEQQQALRVELENFFGFL